MICEYEIQQPERSGGTSGRGEAQLFGPATMDSVLWRISAVADRGVVTAGAWVALHIVGYAMMVLFVGYCFIRLALPQSRQVERIFLAPALGILIASSLGALVAEARIAADLDTAPLAVPGRCSGALPVEGPLVVAEADRDYGWTLVMLSFLVCLVYFLPSARKDAVLDHDGSFRWIYVDTQHFYAIAAGIKGDERTSRRAGKRHRTAPLSFRSLCARSGPFTGGGLDLGDALARVTRGASIWALVLSCFGFGTLLSLRATGQKFGGIMSVTGLFFYGSLLSLFSNEMSSASYVKGAILLTVPGVEVLADGGPFSHILLGHSVLHGMVAITAGLGLCLCTGAAKQICERVAASWCCFQRSLLR